MCLKDFGFWIVEIDDLERVFDVTIYLKRGHATPGHQAKPAYYTTCPKSDSILGISFFYWTEDLVLRLVWRQISVTDKRIKEQGRVAVGCYLHLLLEGLSGSKGQSVD
jgi:hypothetical protein